MNCKRAAELLLDYIDGELDSDVSRELEHHMGDCRPCQVFLSTYKKTTSLCKKTLMASVPKEVEDRLISFLRTKLPVKTD